MRRTLAYQVVGCMAFFVACGITAVASAQTITLRIVTYNIEADSYYGTAALAGLICPFSGTGTFTASCSGSVTNGGVLEGIGEEILGSDPAQPIDILALNETTSNTTTVQPIVNGLNAFYSYHNISAVYTMSTYQATQYGSADSGNGPNALVYNTNTVQLIASVGVGTPGGSGNGEYRQVVRYEFAPAGPTANNAFYIYVSHYKASSGSPNTIYRAEEAGIIRTNSATLPSNARVLYVGDYNMDSSSEAAYQTIVGTGIGIQGIDPLNVTGASGIDFTASSLLSWKTESSRSLHYRDDLQVMSSDVYNGVAGGLAYVSGTYHTFGNNGSVSYKSSIISGNTALSNDLQSNPPISAAQCYTNLYGASDHLPVVADYTIPTGVSCTPPTASVSGGQTICQSGSATIQAALTGTGPWNVTWLDGASGTNFTQNGVAAGPATRTVIPSSTTTYTVTAVSDASGCSGGTSSGSAIVTVNATPAMPTPSNSGPICSGQTLNLFANTTAPGYSWTGPSSFSSSLQNPTISNATTAATGTYNLTVTSNGCTSAAGSTSATVNPIPATPTASNNGPMCSGSTLTLSTPTVTGATYSWTGPSSFSSSLQNPSIPNATSAASGTYGVTVTDTNDCTSAAGTTIATVNAIPATPSPSNNGPICSGQDLNLFANTTADSYSWTGPNSFSSTQQNPSIASATTAATGTYSVIVTVNGCTSAAGSTTALVTALQITSITTQGSDILITWATTGGTTNAVQAAPGNPGYNTNFVNIGAPLLILGSEDTSTNYVDLGAATNSPVMFYRVRLVP